MVVAVGAEMSVRPRQRPLCAMVFDFSWENALIHFQTTPRVLLGTREHSMAAAKTLLQQQSNAAAGPGRHSGCLSAA